MQSFVLATTSQSLLLVETVSGVGYQLDTGRQHYYGIARDLEKYYVGVRHRLNTSPIPKSDERGAIVCFDKSFEFAQEISPQFPLRDIHQILIHDGKLWVTCPFDNMIAIYDGASWEEWYPFGAVDKDFGDVYHFNSLTGFGHELCIVAHNLGAITGKPSELHFFGTTDRRHLRSVTLGFKAHNAWLHDGDLMTCSSGDGALLSQNGIRIHTGGFPRGIAYQGAEIHVGVSKFASRPDRDLGRGWIQIYDRHWAHLRTIEITGEGMITDLLPMTSAEASAILHMRNLPRIEYSVLRHPIEV